MAYTQQSWNRQEASTVLIYILSATGSDRERAVEKWGRFAGDHAAISQGEALWEVQAYGGVGPDGRLNERGIGNALTILSLAGSGLPTW